MRENKMEGIGQGLPAFGERLEQKQQQQEWKRTRTDGLNISPEEMEQRSGEREIIDEYSRKKRTLHSSIDEEDLTFDSESLEDSGVIDWADVRKDKKQRALEEEIEDWFNDLIDTHLAFENMRLRKVQRKGSIFLPPATQRNGTELNSLPSAQSRSQLWRSLKEKIYSLTKELEFDKVFETIIRYGDLLEFIDCPPAMNEDCFRKYLSSFGLSRNIKIAEKHLRLMEEEGIIPPSHKADGAGKGKARQRYYSTIHMRGARAYLILRKAGIPLIKIKEVLEPLAEIQKAVFIFPILYGDGLDPAMKSSPVLPHSLWSFVSLGQAPRMISHFRRALSFKWIRQSDKSSIESAELSGEAKYDLLLSSAIEETKRRTGAVIEAWIVSLNNPASGY